MQLGREENNWKHPGIRTQPYQNKALQTPQLTAQ